MLEASPDEIYDIELEHSLLEANGKLAVENRALLDQHGITVERDGFVFTDLTLSNQLPDDPITR